MDESFFYKSGKFETIKKWNRPSVGSISSFFNHIKSKTDILERYHVILRGGCLYKHLENTLDVDINLSSDSVNYETLENDFLILQNIANDNNILLDINWSSIPISVLYDSGINKENIDKLITTIPDGDWIKIGLIKKIVKGKVIIDIDHRNALNSVGDYLIKHSIRDTLYYIFGRDTYIKWVKSNSAKIKYLDANQIISGNYSALTDEHNKII